VVASAAIVRLILAIAAVLAPLALPAGASALVQVDKGIAGARLGNSRAQVRAALGAPSSTRSGTNDFGPFVQFRYRGGISVLFQGRTEVTSVSTTGRGDRTARDVGVGSSEATVRRRVAGVRCETVAGTRSCHTHEFRIGQVVTDFLLRGGKVTRVTVGRVFD
jgi:hypothetical protein